MLYVANAQLRFVVPCLLYLLLLGDSGSGKSRARTIVLKALKLVEARVQKDEGLTPALRMRVLGLLRAVTGDATSTGILDIFERSATHPAKAAMMSDELCAQLNRWAKAGTQGSASELGTILQLYDGDFVSRTTGEREVSLESVFLQLVACVQPGVFAEAATAAAVKNEGLTARMTMVHGLRRRVVHAERNTAADHLADWLRMTEKASPDGCPSLVDSEGDEYEEEGDGEDAEDGEEDEEDEEDEDGEDDEDDEDDAAPLASAPRESTRLPPTADAAIQGVAALFYAVLVQTFERPRCLSTYTPVRQYARRHPHPVPPAPAPPPAASDATTSAPTPSRAPKAPPPTLPDILFEADDALARPLLVREFVGLEGLLDAAEEQGEAGTVKHSTLCKQPQEILRVTPASDALVQAIYSIFPTATSEWPDFTDAWCNATTVDHRMLPLPAAQRLYLVHSTGEVRRRVSPFGVTLSTRFVDTSATVHETFWSLAASQGAAAAVHKMLLRGGSHLGAPDVTQRLERRRAEGWRDLERLAMQGAMRIVDLRPTRKRKQRAGTEGADEPADAGGYEVKVAIKAPEDRTLGPLRSLGVDAKTTSVRFSAVLTGYGATHAEYAASLAEPSTQAYNTAKPTLPALAQALLAQLEVKLAGGEAYRRLDAWHAELRRTAPFPQAELDSRVLLNLKGTAARTGSSAHAVALRSFQTWHALVWDLAGLLTSPTTAAATILEWVAPAPSRSPHRALRPSPAGVALRQTQSGPSSADAAAASSLLRLDGAVAAAPTQGSEHSVNLADPTLLSALCGGSIPPLVAQVLAQLQAAQANARQSGPPQTPAAGRRAPPSPEFAPSTGEVGLQE